MVEWRPAALRGHKRRPGGAIDEDVPDDVDSWHAQLVALHVRRMADETEEPVAISR